MDKLRYYLKQWNIELSEEQEAQFERYYALLVRKNDVMNLTAITEKSEVEEKHFLDSLALTQALELKGNESLIDVGTGAGFPGLPLKILFPELKVVLADALQKRVRFLQEAIDDLMLTGITAIHARAEELGQDPQYRGQFDLCVSRAVAELPVLCEYCLPLVKPGGVFVSYKSRKTEEELALAASALEILGAVHESTASLILGPSGLERSLVVIRKTTETPEKYPRAAGKIKKKPL